MDLSDAAPSSGATPPAGQSRAEHAREVRLTVNGEPHVLPVASSVAALVERLALAGKRIAVERNGEIVPRSRHADTALSDGDRIEIVVAVGGG